MRPALIIAFLLVFYLPAVAQDDKDAEQVDALRKAVLRDLFAAEDRSQSVAGAYKSLFAHVGLSGLTELVDDEDASIALQAAWELHRKPVKRQTPIRYRTDWVFDSKPMEEFLKIVSKRLKSKPPAWWNATLLKGEVFPGRHHAFVEVIKTPPTATMKAEKQNIVITLGKHSVRIPNAEFREDVDGLEIAAAVSLFEKPVVLFEKDLSYVALPRFRGYPFKLFCLDSKTGNKLWVSTVWAARRGGSTGPKGVNPVEIRRIGDTVVVFGSESHGAYAEGFDSKTGKCQLRFCTCYWFNFSEAWDLK